MPVIAVAPDENARNTNNTVMPSIGSRPTTGVGVKPRPEASTSPAIAARRRRSARKDRAGLADAAQLAHQQDRRSPRGQRNGVMGQAREAEVIAATPAEIHCHREDVLGHEGARHDQGGKLAEVPGGHGVGPPPCG
jgi:hypothetical protein